MAEAVATLGLVVNVLQLVDCARKIVSKGSEILTSVDGSVIENRDLEGCARELLVRNDRLLESLGKTYHEVDKNQRAADEPPTSEQPVSKSDIDDEDDRALESLGNQCHDAARDLIEILSGLKYQGKSRLGSLRQAMELRWSKDKVEKIEERMKNIQAQIDSRLNLQFRLGQRMMAAEQAVMAAEQRQGFATLNESSRAIYNLLTRVEKTYAHQLISPTARNATDLPFSQPRAQQTSSDPSESIHNLAEVGAEGAMQSLLLADPTAIQAEDAEGRTALHIAAQRDNHRLMLLLIRRGANVNAEDNDSSTPLHLAVKSKSARCVRLLVLKFADKDAVDSLNKTPVQYAQRETEVAWILAYGADIEAKDPSRCTALIHFSFAGDVEVVRSLLSQGADVRARGPEGQALFGAASKGFDSIVELLLRADADINATGSRGATALGIAALAGNISTVKLLLTHPEIELDVQNVSRYTALADACAHSHEEVAIALVQAGADLEIANGHGYGPIHLAALNGSISITKELLRRPGVNVQWRGRDGWTAVAEASRHGHEEVVKLLLDHEADVNITGHNDFRTPLHFAAEAGNAPIAKLLLEKGRAHTEVTTESGYTPLHLAAERGHLHVVEELITHGADANKPETGKELWSPLKFAIRGGGKNAKDLLWLLVRKGKADVNYQPGRIGTTALFEAVSCHRPDLISELLELGADANLTDSNPNPGYDKYPYCPPICLAAKESPLNETVSYLQILVEQGKANVNAPRKGGVTALHEVGARGSISAVQYLLSRGADRTLKTQNGETALDYVLRLQPQNASMIVNLLKSEIVKVATMSTK